MKHTANLSGTVGMDLTLSSLQSQMDFSELSSKDSVTFTVNSPGGSVLDGFEIYNFIKNIKAKKIMRIEGSAMSIASLIILAADEIQSSPVSLLMIHKASLGLEGNSDDLRKNAKTLDTIDGILVDAYFSRNQEKGETKLSKVEIMDMLKNETWMSPEEAKNYGFIDTVLEGTGNEKKMAALFNTLLTDKQNYQMKHLNRLKDLLNFGKQPFSKALATGIVKNVLKAKNISEIVGELPEEEVAIIQEQVLEQVVEETGTTELTPDEAAQVEEAVVEILQEITVPEEDAANPAPAPDEMV